jgi:L-type amino acid transporter 9
VEQEIAKEGVLPFSKFWSRQYNMFRGFDRRQAEHGTGETPVLALFLHWIVSFILIMSPPTKDSYTLLSNFYAYTIGACISSLLAGGLIFWSYVYHKARNEWKKLRGFKPLLGLLLPAIYLLASIFMVIAAFILPNGHLLITASIPWYIFPVVGLSQFGVDITYRAIFVYIVPWYRGETFFVKRTPIFKPERLGQVFVLESVESKWVMSSLHIELDQILIVMQVTRGGANDEPGPVSRLY